MIGRGPSTQRALRLLRGGVVGWHLGALPVIGLALAWGGVPATVSALLGAAMALLFSGVGMGTQVVVAERHPRQVLVASLVSYLARAALLGAVLGAYLNDLLPGLRAGWLAAGVLVTTLTWLAAEVLVFARLRIPVFDAEYYPPQPAEPSSPDSSGARS